MPTPDRSAANVPGVGCDRGPFGCSEDYPCRSCYRESVCSCEPDIEGESPVCPVHGIPGWRDDRSAAYRRRPWWRRYTIQSYRVWKLAYRLGLTKEPW